METPNLNYVNDLAGTDLSFRNQFITILKVEFPVEKREYFDHVEHQRLKETADIVHKLKHKFNILGMEDAYRLAVRYESELLDEKMSSESEFKAILETIDRYLKTI